MNQEATEAASLVMYTTQWCSDCHRVKFLLDTYGVRYSEIDIDKDSLAAAYVMNVNGGMRRVPTIIFPDNSMLVEPSSKVLAEKLGLVLERL